MVWTASFFFEVDPTARVGVQAAMMLVLGAVFGIRLMKNGSDK
jgi:hypothetical protein